MTDRDILQKAIEKAIRNSWRKDYINEGEFDIVVRSNGAIQLDNPGCILEDYESIIFSHEFAKAFFPKEIAKMTWYEELKPYSFEDVESWKVHLMKMVLCSNPIDYLRPFLDNTETL